MTYKPLPQGVTIRESPIHGLGLYATEKLSKGTMLGVIHYPRGEDYLRTPLGGFGNHSDDPNCTKMMMQEDGAWWVFAIKDIEPDEEITWKYTLYDIH